MKRSTHFVFFLLLASIGLAMSPIANVQNPPSLSISKEIDLANAAVQKELPSSKVYCSAVTLVEASMSADPIIFQRQYELIFRTPGESLRFEKEIGGQTWGDFKVFITMNGEVKVSKSHELYPAKQ